MYDRRRIKLGPIGKDGDFTPPILAFCPPHLSKYTSSHQISGGGWMSSGSGGGGPSHATCVDFSPDGSQLLATYHNDHAFLFDVVEQPAAPELTFDSFFDENDDERHVDIDDTREANAVAVAGANAGASAKYTVGEHIQVEVLDGDYEGSWIGCRVEHVHEGASLDSPPASDSSVASGSSDSADLLLKLSSYDVYVFDTAESREASAVAGEIVEHVAAVHLRRERAAGSVSLAGLKPPDAGGSASLKFEFNEAAVVDPCDWQRVVNGHMEAGDAMEEGRLTLAIHLLSGCEKRLRSMLEEEQVRREGVRWQGKRTRIIWHSDRQEEAKGEQQDLRWEMPLSVLLLRLSHVLFGRGEAYARREWRGDCDLGVVDCTSKYIPWCCGLHQYNSVITKQHSIASSTSLRMQMQCVWWSPF
jgi:hypothetical protein